MAVRMKQVLFRFDYKLFRDSMSRLGVELPRAPPNAGYIVPSGIIQVGDGLGVEIDLSRGVIASRGTLPAQTVDLFNKMITCVGQDLSLNLNEYAWFYEMICRCSVNIGKDPIEALFNRFGSCYNQDKLEHILGRKSQVNRVRIGPKLADAHRPDYYDIDIMPDIFRPRDSFHVEFVYRDPKPDPIAKVAGSMEQVISDIVSTAT